MPGRSEKYDSLPIPTYEEATSSRPSSSASYRGPEDERQGLLGHQSTSATTRAGHDDRGNYRAPTVESERSSYDSAFTSPAVTEDEDEAEEAGLRQDLEEMEVSDPEAERRAQQRARMRREFQKRIASVTSTFSSFHLPRLPTISFFTSLRSRFQRLPLPERSSVSWPIVARLVALLLIAGFIYVLIVIKVMPSRGAVVGARFDPDQVRDFLMRHVDPSKFESHLRELSFDDHVAGTKGDIYWLAHWIEEAFVDSQMDSVYNEDFKIVMNFPRPNNEGRHVAIADPLEKQWESSLAEDLITEDLTNPVTHPPQTSTLTRHQTSSFQPYSKTGDVTGPLIYANYGSHSDFDWLHEHGIVTNGSIALMRHYGSQPSASLKIAAAQDAGCIGALVYSDPAEDGHAQIDAPPSSSDEPWRTPDSVHRTSAAFHNRILGDPLTPGWSSTPDTDRLDRAQSLGLPSIPSLPLPWRDAEPLLSALQNVGAPVPGNFAGLVPNVAYWTGNASSEISPRVRLQNDQDDVEQQTIRNILGELRGLEEPDEPIYVGAPRDALCFGATQPGSGTAILIELARLFGGLAQNGWRPRRTIKFVSWDGSQYNAAGSTEHVESRLDDLRLHGVSYINLDAAVYGNQLKARGSPVFKSLLHATLPRIVDPSTNTSLLETWNASRADLESLPTTLGDFLPFHDLAGVSALDLSFISPLNADRAPPGADTASVTQQTPVAFPAGSCHDTYTWLTTHGDPGFVYHTLLTQLVSLLIFELADAPVLPLDLGHYTQSITADIEQLISDFHAGTSNSDTDVDQAFNLQMLRDAASSMNRNVEKFEASFLATMGALIEPDGSQSSKVMGAEPRELAARRVAQNQRMAEFESHLLDLPLPSGVNMSDDAEPQSQDQVQGGALPIPSGPTLTGESGGQARRSTGAIDEAGYGLPWAPQYKHVLHGPRKWDSGSNRAFPAIREAFEAGDWDGVRKAVEVASERLRWAGWRLGH